MWICPNCGEHNEDHFQQCWKCVSDTVQEAARPKSAAPARQMRPFGWVLFRAVVAFVLGTLVGIAITHRHSRSLADAAASGVVIGLIIGGGVGVVLWVLFPYKPGPAPETPDVPDQDL